MAEARRLDMLVICGDQISARMAGPSIRAWELAWALHRTGLNIALASPSQEIPPAPFETLSFNIKGEALRAAAERSNALLVQGLVLAHYPFLAALDVPLVVDVYDPFVLENLPQRASETMAGRQHAHRKDLAALNAQLERGDFFLCASEQQRDYWLGMLTALDRINPETYDSGADLRRLLDIVPFGLPPEPPTLGQKRMKGVFPGIAQDDQVLLWGGGIWNWFDPLTLVHAMAKLRETKPSLKLFFLGKRSPSLEAPKLKMAGEAESLAKRLGLLNESVFFNDAWVPYAERGDYLLEADIGVSCHLPHIETRFAFRTRLLDCIWAGLPMVVTEGDVLADLVEQESLGAAVPPENPDALAEALIKVLDAPDGRAGYAERFQAVREEMSWDRAAEPLIRYSRNPYRAADLPELGREPDALAATPLRGIPKRALEVLKEGGPLLLFEEALRYIRWRRRPG